MTDKLDALDRLIEAVEAGGDMGRLAFRPLCEEGRIADRNSSIALSVYNGDLNAALALHEALLPGWVRWNMQESVFGHECDLTNGDKEASGISKESMSRAWLLAILRAYRSEVQG